MREHKYKVWNKEHTKFITPNDLIETEKMSIDLTDCCFKFKNSNEALEAFKEYQKLGYSISAMDQKDTKRQKELICIMIDKVKGEVKNDWDGEIYTDRENAKKYVMEYNN